MSNKKSTKSNLAGKSGPPPRRVKPKKVSKVSVPHAGQLIVSQNEPAVNSTAVMKVDCELDTAAYQLPFISFYSHLCQTGVPNIAGADNTVNPYSFIAAGVNYLYTEIQSYIISGIPSPNRVPMVFRELVAALLTKTVKTKNRTSLSFGWTSPPFSSLPSINVGNYNWTFQEPAADNGSYAESTIAVMPAPDQGAYNAILTYLDQTSNPRLKPVDNLVANSPLFRSVSAFARNYSYNGLSLPNGTTVDSFYKDIELEVPIYQPMMAQFAPYGNETRVPRYLTTSSGDAESVYGLPLTTEFVDYNNTGKLVYKCIDFENIYDVCASWAVLAKQSLMSDVTAGFDSDPNTGQFTFTQQDFRIMLRQALVSFFATSYWTQFVGPLANQGSNYFQPFYITGNTFGSPQFQQLQLPQLIVENLSALCTRVIEYTTKRKRKIINRMVPILGRYVLDTPSSYVVSVYANQVVENSFDLFATVPQQTIDLIDGHTPSGYVNLNGTYYANLVVSWNNFCTGANKVSTQIASLANDKGPTGMVCLSLTKVLVGLANPTKRKPTFVLDDLQVDERFVKRNSGGKLVVPDAPPPPRRKMKIMERVSNYQLPMSGKGAIPPSTSSLLVPTSMLSQKVLTNIEVGMYVNLILPTIRFDTESTPQILNLTKYQTEVSEFANHQFVNPNNIPTAAQSPINELATLQNLAQFCIKGSGGSDSQYANLVKMLADTSHAGILSGILGAFAKTILPAETHGIIDGIAESMPF